MSAGVWNITIEQGTTWNPPIAWSSGGSLVNTAGYTALMDIRTSSGTLIQHLGTDNGIIVVGIQTISGTQYNIVPNLADTVTVAMTASPVNAPYVYDLFLISGTGIATRLLTGTCVVVASITQPPD